MPYRQQRPRKKAERAATPSVPYGFAPQQRPTNPIGTAGMVLALVGVLVPCALPVGLVFGLIGLNRSGDGRRPRGQAKAAVVVSAVVGAIWIIVIIAVRAHRAATGT
jgi:hypothetical protein